MKSLFSLLLTSTLLFSASLVHASDSEEYYITLEQVPAQVMEAANSELAGFTPESAKKEVSNRYTEYEIRGKANGKIYKVEIKVNGDGQIIKIERESRS